VGTQDGIIVVATANDPTCLDPAILKRPGRFDRVVQFRNQDADLRRQYYRRLSSVLTGEQFETAIEKTEGFSFAQLRETYILGAQSAFEHGREVSAGDVIDAIDLQAAGAQDLKTLVAAPGLFFNQSILTGAESFSTDTIPMRKELERRINEQWPHWFNTEGDFRYTAMPRGFEHDDGWFDILWRLFEALEPLAAEIENKTGCPFEVLQVKEKFGGLRVHVNHRTEGIHKLIEQAEEESLHTCEVCGQLGKRREGDWIKTLCATKAGRRL
jgi:hypothetical protein